MRYTHYDESNLTHFVIKVINKFMKVMDIFELEFNHSKYLYVLTSDVHVLHSIGNFCKYSLNTSQALHKYILLFQIHDLYCDFYFQDNDCYFKVYAFHFYRNHLHFHSKRVVNCKVKIVMMKTKIANMKNKIYIQK